MDMEVAGHWRREWAGTAEFGNVTEGGVTRRVARAMEVLNASTPGTKVRVMRAAYHSTAGPGTSAASFLMHSSRRVISSGFNFMESPFTKDQPFIESPSTPSKPLEISSMPLDHSHVENTNYKVTEPDDTEISEPSKWKVSTGVGSVRLSSEESSSTDNASIVDLDWKRRGSNRKSSGDSESSDFQYTKRNSIDIPIRLSSPTSLSTLKFKSLLNGQQSDWNDRRKSYSFEDTAPLNETVIQSNDTLAMESSTDSGICKSTELVNDPTEIRYASKTKDQHDDIYNRNQGSFTDWLSKNRRSSYHKSNRSPLREHDSIDENTGASNITLRSQGKVTITVPIILEQDNNNHNKNKTNDDRERRVKRVEFCKTELHFAADSGKVNIIATDDKPPPSNDFRKRRSAFVPLHENFDKPITLFGEKNKDIFNTNNILFHASNNVSSENDENTAATKSILKNKIPKPKPYLLGENMAFGVSNELINNENTKTESIVPSAVLLINKQLQAGRTSLPEDDVVGSKMNKTELSRRTLNDGPVNSSKVSSYRALFERENQSEIIHKNKSSAPRSPSPIKNRFKLPQLSPIPGRAHTRQLRDSDLIYFGVNKDEYKISNEKHTEHYGQSSQDLFESVKLVRKISSSVCNSEAESEDTPEYINITYKSNFAPVPAPRTSKLNDIAEDNVVESRRSRSRRSAEHSTSSRSISEPPKFGRNSLERANRRRQQKNIETSTRSKNADETKVVNNVIQEDEDPTSSGKVSPLYVNIGVANLYADTPNAKVNKKSVKSVTSNACKEKPRTANPSHSTDSLKIAQNLYKKGEQRSPDKNHTTTDRKVPIKNTRQRTEKLATPEHSDENPHWPNSEIQTSIGHKKSSSTRSSMESRKKERESKKVLNTNSIASTNKSETKRDPKIYEDKVKNALRRADKELVDHTKITRTVHRSPSAARKTNAVENTSNEAGRRSTSLRIQDKYTTKLPEGKSSKYKRSEYVINYDDKNGTVSSICKVTPPPPPGHSITKRHKLKEAKEKTKVSDKTSLLQLPEPDWAQNYYSSHKRTDKLKKKINIQRSCQLL